MIERYYRMPEIQHIATTAPHAYFIPFDSAEDAAKGREYSDRFISLCGDWDFRFFNNVEELDFNAPDFPSGVVCNMPMRVPMCWQLELEKGLDVPNYINQDYPFPVDPPNLPDEIPCGFYRKNINLKKKADKKYYINFDGVSSCFYLWVNGEFAGYSEVSHCNSEFDISEMLSDGANVFEILVIKHCTGSYMEDQDFFRLSGIFRPVYILERDRAHLRDIQIKTAVQNDFSSAVITVTPMLLGEAVLNWTLASPDGITLAGGESAGEFSVEVKSPLLWSDETPVLYTLKTDIGKEHIEFPIGIKRIEIKDRCLLLNGQKIKLRGINRHDTDPETGYYVSLPKMLNELYLLKNANVNTIRTSHYPNDPRFLELCDRLGFMLIDEADLECHGMGNTFGDWDWKYWAFICDDPAWKNACVDRAQRLYERDKNHACVVMWSLGNESGCGRNHRHMANYIRSRDDKAIIHYENAHLEYEKRIGENFGDISDVESRMYASVDYLKEYLENPENKKPFFYCEYVSSQCTGDIPLHWDGLEKYNNYCGGCVWEFADHAVNIGTESAPRYRYGGDFNDWPNNGISCVDGLVYPDRAPRPGFFDMKDSYKPFEASYNNGIISIKNKRFFTSLKDTDIAWSLEENGRFKEGGTIESPDIKPQQTESFKLFEAYEPVNFTTLNIFLLRHGNSEWSENGAEIGHSQFILKNCPITFSAAEKSDISAIVTRGDISIKNNNYSCVFSRISGKLVSVNNGGELFSEPLEFALSRSCHPWSANAGAWKKARFDKIKQKTYSCELTQCTPEAAIIKTDVSFGAAAMPPAVRAQIEYTFTNDGKIKISVCARVDEKAPPLPRFGLQLSLPAAFNKLKYIGYGPVESYCDRFRSQRISEYKTTVRENFEHYIFPCESSAHFRTKTAAVTDSSGRGFVICDTSENGFSFNAKNYSDEQLSKAKHDDELTELDKTIVNIDYKMHADNPGFADREPWRLFSEKEFSFLFELVPVK